MKKGKKSSAMEERSESRREARAEGDKPLKAAGGGNFIAGAIKHPGALHKQMGVPAGKKIPAGKLAKAAKAPGKLGQRARFAQTLKGLGK